MAITKVLGKLLTISISTNLVTPDWKLIVCREGGSLTSNKDEIVRDTACGVLKAYGNVSWAIEGSGVANATPEAGEVSADELLVLFQDSTEVLFKITHTSGDTVVYREGRGTLSGYNEEYPVDNLMSFDFTLGVDGDIEIAA